jgi:hypothetical protein
LRQVHGILPAVIQAATREGAERGGNAGLGTKHGVGGQGFVFAAGLFALGQAGHVFCAVQAAARIGRVGHHFQLATAHVGVNRLRLHPQEAARLVH